MKFIKNEQGFFTNKFLETLYFQGLAKIDDIYNLTYAENSDNYYIHSYHPYDSTEYCWARCQRNENLKGKWTIYDNGKRIMTCNTIFDTIEQMKLIDSKKVACIDRT